MSDSDEELSAATRDASSFVNMYVDGFLFMTKLGIDPDVNQVELCAALIASNQSRDEMIAAYSSAIRMLADERTRIARLERVLSTDEPPTRRRPYA